MEFLRRELKNGTSVIMEKRELSVVSVCVANRFGAAFEESKIKGIAHFIEHLVFTGTKTRSHEDISKEIEKKGGILNAFTSNEITGFWFKMPTEYIFKGLEIIHDILENPKFDKGKFEKEKKVILEEIKMYHDDPSRDVYRILGRNLYEIPFGEGIIGKQDTIKRLKRDFVYNYYKEHYNPENYIVSIVGNADFNKVCSYLERNFKRGKSELKESKIVKRNAESVEEREGIDQAHFIFAVHAPLLTDKDYYALEVLDAYLANGMSSKLFLKIREEKGLAYSIQSAINMEKNYSFYSIYVGTTKEALPEIKKIILEEFANVSKIGDKELSESKERLIGLRKISSEESFIVMNELLFAELAGGAEEYYKHEEKIRAVTLDDVKKLAVKLIKKYSTAAIVPK